MALPTTGSFPDAFLEELQSIVSANEYQKILDALLSERQPSFRVNTLLVSVVKIVNELERLAIPFETVPWCEEALLIEEEQKHHVMESSLYQKNFLYPQSLSSILATIVLDPKPLEEILDMCAAPGSKTSHIAARMENKGAIIANDNSRSRMYKLQTNLKSLGVLNAKITTLPGEWMWKKYPEMFDRVLVDAPCSMEGRFVLSDPKTYEDWKPSKGKLLSQKQKYLLRSAVGCAKKGGTIVYATCTLNPRENEEVVDWLLKTEKDVQLIDVAVDGLTLQSGMTSWKHKEFNPELEKTVRILPTKIMEGFFLAKFRKL